MSYTKIAKPTTTYTQDNAPSKERYNESGITYSDSTVTYNGRVTGYTDLSKPTTSYTKIAKP